MPPLLGCSVSDGVRPGASGIGELIANTCAVRNVTVVVLDVNPVVTENCACTKAMLLVMRP